MNSNTTSTIGYHVHFPWISGFLWSSLFNFFLLPNAKSEISILFYLMCGFHLGRDQSNGQDGFETLAFSMIYPSKELKQAHQKEPYTESQRTLEFQSLVPCRLLVAGTHSFLFKTLPLSWVSHSLFWFSLPLSFTHTAAIFLFIMCVCWRIWEYSILPGRTRKTNRMDETHKLW